MLFSNLILVPVVLALPLASIQERQEGGTRSVKSSDQQLNKRIDSALNKSNTIVKKNDDAKKMRKRDEDDGDAGGGGDDNSNDNYDDGSIFNPGDDDVDGSGVGDNVQAGQSQTGANGNWGWLHKKRDTTTKTIVKKSDAAKETRKRDDDDFNPGDDDIDGSGVGDNVQAGQSQTGANGNWGWLHKKRDTTTKTIVKKNDGQTKEMGKRSADNSNSGNNVQVFSSLTVPSAQPTAMPVPA